MIHIKHIVDFIKKNILNGAITALLIALVISIITSINVINYTNNLHDDLKTMYEKDIIGQSYIQTARVNLIYIYSETKNLFLLNDDEIDPQVVKIRYYENGFREYLSSSRPLFYSEKARGLFISVDAAYSEYRILLDETIRSFKDNKKETAKNILLNDLKIRNERLDNLLNKLDVIKQENDLKYYKKIVLEHEITIVVTILLLVGTIVIRILLFLSNRNKRVFKN